MSGRDKVSATTGSLLQLDAAGEGKGDGGEYGERDPQAHFRTCPPFIHLSNKTKEANTER